MPQYALGRAVARLRAVSLHGGVYPAPAARSLSWFSWVPSAHAATPAMLALSPPASLEPSPVALLAPSPPTMLVPKASAADILSNSETWSTLAPLLASAGVSLVFTAAAAALYIARMEARLNVKSAELEGKMNATTKDVEAKVGGWLSAPQVQVVSLLRARDFRGCRSASTHDAGAAAAVMGAPAATRAWRSDPAGV